MNIPQPKPYAVLIPTKGRPKSLTKLFEKQPFLNHPSTFIGLDIGDTKRSEYDAVLEDKASRVTVVSYANKHGITSVARERLREAVFRSTKPYKTILPLDDNMFYAEESLRNLVWCSQLLQAGSKSPIIVSGEHPTAPHFQGDRIASSSSVVHNGDLEPRFRVFKHTTVIYWAIPATLYARYQYPVDCCFDDIHLALWMMTHGGVREFFVCRDAPFDKRRFEAGGQGNAAERAVKFGKGITRLALDFPQWMTTGIVQTRIPYAKIQEAIGNGKESF